MKTPATDEEAAQHKLRVKFVTPLANVRSWGATTAATYDCLVGTSISTRASRRRNSVTAQRAEGTKEAAIRKRLEGKWVNTMVLINPIRLASQAAPRCESAFST